MKFAFPAASPASAPRISSRARLAEVCWAGCRCEALEAENRNLLRLLNLTSAYLARAVLDGYGDNCVVPLSGALPSLCRKIARLQRRLDAAEASGITPTRTDSIVPATEV